MRKFIASIFLLTVLLAPMARAELMVSELHGFNVGGGAPLEFVGFSTVSTGTGATISLPTTGLTGGTDTEARVGDLLIAITGWNNTTNGNPEVTDGTFTWTEVADLYSNDSHDANLSVAWANATTTPPANVTATGVNAAARSNVGVLLVFRHHNSATPMDATPTTATGIDASTADAPSIDSVTAKATIIAIGLNAFTDAGSDHINAAPATYTMKGNPVNTDGTTGEASIGAAILEDQAAGTHNPAAFGVNGTATSASWAAVTIAVRPE